MTTAGNFALEQNCLPNELKYIKDFFDGLAKVIQSGDPKNLETGLEHYIKQNEAMIRNHADEIFKILKNPGVLYNNIKPYLTDLQQTFLEKFKEFTESFGFKELVLKIAHDLGFGDDCGCDDKIVIARNDYLNAVDDKTLIEKGGINIPVLHNDVDMVGRDNLFITKIYDVRINGKLIPADSKLFTLEISADHKSVHFEYNGPDKDFLNHDIMVSFSYQVADGDGNFDSAHVTIPILGKDAQGHCGDYAPVAHNDYVDPVKEGSIVKVSPLGNDYDPDGGMVCLTDILKVTIDGKEIPLNKIKDFIHVTKEGEVIVDTAKLPDVNKNYLINITYQVTDSEGDKDTAHIIIPVKGQEHDCGDENHPPIANDDNAGVVKEGTFLTVPILSNDSDPDGDKLIVSLKGVTINGKHIPDNIAAKYITYNHQTHNLEVDTSKLDIPNGKSVDIEVLYSVNDGHGGTDTAVVKFEVVDDNQCPVVKNVCYEDDEDGLNTVNPNDTLVDGDLVFSFKGKDADGDNLTYHIKTGTFTHDGVTYTVAGSTASNVYTVTTDGKTFTVKDLGNGNFELDTSEFQYLNDGETQQIWFKYYATDSHGGHSEPAFAMVTIFGTDDGSQVTLVASDQQFIDDEDAIDGTGATADNYTDHDDGISGALQFTINNVSYNGSNTLAYSGVPATIVGSDGKTYNVVDNGNGTFTVDKSEFQHLAQGQLVTLAFAYTVTDGILTSSAEAKVVIIGTNDGPVAVDDNVGTIGEGSTTTVAVLNNDSDPDGDVIHITSITKLVIDGVEIPADQISKYITILPDDKLFVDTSLIGDKDHNFNIVVTYEISDPYGLKDTADVTINVENNDIVTYFGDTQNDSYSVDTLPSNSVDDVIINSGSISGLQVVYDDNTIVLDDANAYGDLQNLTLSATAADANAFATPTSQGGTEFAVAITDAVISNNNYQFGDDNITANRGVIVGDVEQLSLFGHQGNATAGYDQNCSAPYSYATANVSIIDNQFNFGNDVLKIDNGDVFGDVKSLNFSYIDGTTSGNGITSDNDNWVHGNSFNFGDDTISARIGTLTGDLNTATVDGITYNLSTSSGLSDFMATDVYANNTFNFGHDNFALDLTHGVNVAITDFAIGGVSDTLSLAGLTDVDGGGASTSDLSALSKLVDDGSGHLRLQIDANNDGTFESSITFTNIAYDSSKTEITDYNQFDGHIIFS